MNRIIDISSVVFVVFLFVNISILFSQTNITYEKISIKDGLSHNEIWDFEQDKYGYMWIATADGLNKYDGYTFSIYKNDPSDTNSIPSNKVTNVLEDSNGIIWVTTNNGLSKFDRKTEKFQSYRFSNSNRDNSNFISSVFEDSKKNLWVATTDGILSFDRLTNKFTTYELLREDNTIAAQTAPTYELIESSTGELYASSIAQGLLRFDYETNLFVQLKLKNEFQNNLTRSVVFIIEEDSNGHIWYGNRKGVFKIDPVNLVGEKIYNNVTGKHFASGTGIIQVDKNTLWIGSFNDGLFSYNLETKEMRKLPVNEMGLFGMYFDGTGLLWMGSFNGILKFNFNKAPYELYQIDSDVDETKPIILSFSLSTYDPNKIWLGSTKGLRSFDRIKKRFIENTPAINKINSNYQLNIEDVVEINGRHLYLGTTRNGLIRYDLKNNSIKRYSPERYSRSSILFEDVNVLLADSKNRLWVGQEDGVLLLNEDSETFTHIPNFDHRKYSPELIKFLHSLRAKRDPISDIVEVGDYADLSKDFVIAEDSYVLVSGIGEGNSQWGMVDYGSLQSENGKQLWSMSEINNTFKASGALKNRHKIGIEKLPKGRYKLKYKTDDSHSVASYNQIPPQDSLYWGVELYVLSEEEYLKYEPVLKNDEKKSFMTGRNVMSLFESSDNKIWASTIGGLSELDPNTFEIINYTSNAESSIALSSDMIEDVCEDNYGNLWIATQNGLNRFNRNNNTVSIYREKDGLPSNNLRALLVDNEGNLWASGIKGISKVELSNNTKPPIFINYDVRDGLQGYSFIGNSAIKDGDGKLYFSGPDGLNAFAPGITDKSLPQIVFTNLSVSNKSTSDLYESLLNTKELNDIKEIKLSYDQNDISFEFSSIHFARPDKNRLQYKLEGVDDGWLDGSRRYASYANLGPGEYILKVSGSNGDGFWIEKPRQLKIFISPAWWNNIYAYFLYALVFFGLLFSVRKFEINRQHKNTQLKESRLQIEAAEAKAEVAEAKALMVQAENERKTQELEEARELQLSMLPRELPQLANLDIAVYMKTATEVGGDYYDFHVGMDGTLTVVLGDATGHGMKAGTMVTSVKSLFNVLAPNPDIVLTFHEITRCIKLMQMEKLSMCMTMLKIKGDTLQMSAAGMPPTFIYKHNIKTIEEHVFKGMPLGTMDNFPYDNRETKLESGDTILVMSDGFPELQNKDNEQYGYKKTRNKFEEVAEGTPEQIIDILKNEGSDWVDGVDPDDDVTFVVIKVK